MGEIEGSSSKVDEGEPSEICDELGEFDDITESRDVGASRRKLQSRPFLSQFAQDGCFTSHCIQSKRIQLERMCSG